MKKLVSLFLLMTMIIITACDDRELNSKPLSPPPPETTGPESSDNISQEEAVAMADEATTKL